MEEENKAIHFANVEDLISSCKDWIYEEDRDAFYRWFDFGAMEDLINLIERLQKEIKLENALNSEKTVQNSKLKYLIDSNLEKLENGEYIVDSNACQTLVRHLIRLVNKEDYDVTCLHCETDTPLYCEKCYQDLITKNGELQLENDRYKRIKPIMLDGGYELNVEEFLGISDKLYELERNSIPKQK